MLVSTQKIFRRQSTPKSILWSLMYDCRISNSMSSSLHKAKNKTRHEIQMLAANLAKKTCCPPKRYIHTKLQRHFFTTSLTLMRAYYTLSQTHQDVYVRIPTISIQGLERLGLIPARTVHPHRQELLALLSIINFASSSNQRLRVD